MAVRFFDAYGDGDQEIMEDYQDFWDVSPGHWAAGYIEDAAQHGWVVGYGDGTFQPEDEISRAEVVTIVNRLLGREADQDYIASGPRGLVRFPDVPSSHWAYYDILRRPIAMRRMCPAIRGLAGEVSKPWDTLSQGFSFVHPGALAGISPVAAVIPAQAGAGRQGGGTPRRLRRLALDGPPRLCYLSGAAGVYPPEPHPAHEWAGMGVG